MATNTWSSSASTDGNLGSNWSLGSLSSSDDLVFNATSKVACTFTAAIACNTFTAASTYNTNLLNDGGQSFTVASTVSLACSLFTATGAWTQTGDANFTIGSATTTLTVSSMDVTLHGTGTFAISHTSIYIHSLTCSASGKTTTLNGTASTGIRGGAGCLTLDTGTLTVTQNPFRIEAISSATCLSNAGATIQQSGSGSLLFSLGAASITHTLPAIDFNVPIKCNNSGTGAGTGTIELSDTFNSTATLTINGSVASGSTLTFKTNDHAITCGALSIGADSAGCGFIMNCGSAAITAASLTGSASGGTLNMSTSSWIVKGNWNNGALTVSESASYVSLQNTGSANITSSGQNFFDLDVNATGLLSTNDGLTVTGDLTITHASTMNISTGTNTISGTCTASVITTTVNSGIITFQSDFTVSSGKWSFGVSSGTTTFYGNVTLTATCALSASSAPFTFAATSGTQQITSNSATGGFGATTHNGSGGTVQLMDAAKFYSLTLTAGTFNQNGQSMTLSGGAFTWNSSSASNVLDGAISAVGISRGASSAGTISNTITLTGSSTITCNGKSWYDITKVTSGSYTCNDNLTCHDLNIYNVGLTVSNYSLTCHNLITQNGAVLVANSSAISISGDFTMLGLSSLTFTINGSTSLTMSATTGTQTISSQGNAGVTFPVTTFNTNLTLTAAQGLFTFTRLTFGADGSTLTLTSGKTFTISNLAAADWTGSIGNLNSVRASTAGSKSTLAIPNGVTLSYMYPKDNTLSGGTANCTDGTSINGGNTVNWLFPSTTARMGSGFITFQDPGVFI